MTEYIELNKTTIKTLEKKAFESALTSVISYAYDIMKKIEKDARRTSDSIIKDDYLPAFKAYYGEKGWQDKNYTCESLKALKKSFKTGFFKKVIFTSLSLEQNIENAKKRGLRQSDFIKGRECIRGANNNKTGPKNTPKKEATEQERIDAMNEDYTKSFNILIEGDSDAIEVILQKVFDKVKGKPELMTEGARAVMFKIISITKDAELTKQWNSLNKAINEAWDKHQKDCEKRNKKAV